jgi:hypothetical protein
MIKVSLFRGSSGEVQNVFSLFSSSSADKEFEKKAEPFILPDVTKYISNLKPLPGSQYVLVNAMGSGEFYSSNINGDWFDESGLIHCPDVWHGVPAIDKVTSKDWPYGFPTFYNAHSYGHHRNKDPLKSYGDVELTTWNPRMHRVELIIRVDKDKCDKFGGTSIWDKLKMGQYIDVSMGSKVCYDLCSICTDWPLYHKALATFDPKKHKYAGEAALQYHKQLVASGKSGIRGLSITRNDYCTHTKRMMNRILPDGRKVFVYNPFPRFFDISFVFIGADKTAKVMYHVKMAQVPVQLSAASAVESEYMAMLEGQEKAASVGVDILKEAFLGKQAKLKRGEIEKHGPAQFDARAIPVVTKHEPSIQNDVLDEMARSPLSSILSSSGSMGIALRPKEFQRIIIIRMGLRPLADDLDKKNIVFPKVESEGASRLDVKDVLPELAHLLSSIFSERSALSPALDQRVTVVMGKPGASGRASPSSLPTKLLHKIGSAYSGYRKSLMDFWAEDSRPYLEKTAGTCSPLSFDYLKHAYWNEVGKL